MMRSEFLADIKLGEKIFKHGERLPLHHHALKVRTHVRVLVPGLHVPEVDEKFLGGAVGVSQVRVM